jgi:hypothetical protein
MEPADGVPASVSSGVVGYILHHPSVLMPERNDITRVCLIFEKNGDSIRVHYGIVAL